MIEFTGTYNATIDDKGRVVLPSAFKKEMGELALESLIIERNLFKDCLDIYPEKFWKDRVEAFKSTLDPFERRRRCISAVFLRELQKSCNGRQRAHKCTG